MYIATEKETTPTALTVLLGTMFPYRNYKIFTLRKMYGITVLMFIFTI